MTSRLPLIMLASLLVIAGLVWLGVSSNQSGQLRLEGQVEQVRTFAIQPQATLVFADFRISNPTGTPFVVDSVAMELERPNQPPDTGGMLSKREIETVFNYEKSIGPKQNDPLGAQDRIEPGATVTRMVSARFELPESDVKSRTALRVRITELDRNSSVISEPTK